MINPCCAPVSRLEWEFCICCFLPDQLETNLTSDFDLEPELWPELAKHCGKSILDKPVDLANQICQLFYQKLPGSAENLEITSVWLSVLFTICRGWEASLSASPLQFRLWGLISVVTCHMSASCDAHMDKTLTVCWLANCSLQPWKPWLHIDTKH